MTTSSLAAASGAVRALAPSRAPRRLTLLGLAIVVTTTPAILLAPASLGIVLDDSQQLLAALLAVAALVLAAWRARGEARIVPLVLAGALVLVASGLAAWSSDPAARLTAGGPSIGLFAAAVVVFGSVLLWASLRGMPRERLLPAALQSLIVAAAATTLLTALWGWLVDPSRDDPGLKLALAAAIAIVAGPGATFLALIDRRVRPGLWGPFALIDGLTLGGLAWLGWQRLVTQGTAEAVAPMDPLLSVAALLIAWAGITWGRAPVASDRFLRFARIAADAFPIAAVAACTFLTLVAPDREAYGFVRAGAAVVVALTLARQVLLIRSERRTHLAEQSSETRRRALEDQLQQAQKMEAVGRLAGGVAHDFNNLLTAISGYGELLLDATGPADPRRADVEEILRAAERAADLTRQLLAFSRRQVLQAKVIDLNAAVVEAQSLLARVIGEDVAVRTTLAPGLPPVRVDPVQVTQVLLNLALNARDAMPGGGTLSIETGAAVLDEAYARGHPEVSPGPHVMLAVTDTGCGMDADTLSHAFEPFFTTKPVGQGTGLGLATVFGIVAQSGGTVWVYSEPGLGTTFKVYLPAVGVPVTTAPSRQITAAPRRAEAETILLAEDDAGVRALVERQLSRAGYRVLAADGPEAAEAAARSCPGPIHLLVSDVVMPGRSGPGLAESVRSARPEMRVLFMSGYPRDSIGHGGSIDEGVAFITKPFAGDALLRAVRDVLDGPSAPSG